MNGLSAEKEVPISLEFGTYTKRLFIDLLVLSRAIFELKAVEAVNPAHESQLFNYLFLTGLQQGKIVNMATKSVTGKRLLTQVTQSERRRFEIIRDIDSQLDTCVKKFYDLATELLADWGCFLSPYLYAEALSSLAGQGKRPTRIAHKSGGRRIGSVDLRLLARHSAFEVTALTGDLSNYEIHLGRLLRHTPLETIEWIHLDHHQVRFKTIHSE